MWRVRPTAKNIRRAQGLGWITCGVCFVALVLIFFKAETVMRSGPVVALFGLLSGFFGGIAGNQGGLRSAALSSFGLSSIALVATGTATNTTVYPAVNQRSTTASAIAAMPPARTAAARWAHTLGGPNLAEVQISAIRSTRSGACAATHMATMPPSESPPRWTRAPPTWSSSASTSRPRSSRRYGPAGTGGVADNHGGRLRPRHAAGRR